MAYWNCLIFMVFLATISAWQLRRYDEVFWIPAECKNPGFCSVKPVGYHKLEEKMNNLLPKYLLQENSRTMQFHPTRVLSSRDDWDNCPYYTKTESSYLYLYKESDKIKVDIIVQTNLFRQIITSVECATDKIPKGNAQCFQDIPWVQSGELRATCHTTKVNRSLYVLDMHNNEIVKKLFAIPVCCSCATQFQFLTRN